MPDIILSVEGLSKRYKLYAQPWQRAAEWLSFGRMSRHDEFWALQDISFQVGRGEALGIIGPNGAGKSTLLKILSRALWPTGGRFQVRGLMVSLLELGTGFNPQLTGSQNIYNSARLLGFSEDYVRRRFDEIADFSGLGEFMERPIRIYSSGMYVRLAFSLFACLDPEIYVIDEALAVGDASFQKKCVDRINEMRQRGVTILFVSHDLWRVEALCNRALYLEQGRIQACDESARVVRRYLDAIEAKSAIPGEPAAAAEPEPRETVLAPQWEMYADSPLRIRTFRTCDAGGLGSSAFGEADPIAIDLEYDCREPVREPVFRVVVALPDDRRVAVVGWHPGAGGVLQPGRGRIRWHIQAGTLYPRRYVLHASISTWDGVVFDTQLGVAQFQIARGESGPVFRNTDDLMACLSYTVNHEGPA